MLGEVRDAKSYVTGLKVSLTGKCSSLEGCELIPSPLNIWNKQIAEGCMEEPHSLHHRIGVCRNQ